MFLLPWRQRYSGIGLWVLLAMASVLGSSAAAQVMHLGPKVAYQSVWLLNQNNYGLSEMDYELTSGPAYGGSIGVDYGDHWGVQLEFQYAHMGQNYEDNIGLQLIYGINDVFVVRKEVDLIYGQVPLLVRYRNGGEKANFLAVFGPQVGVRGEATLRYFLDGDSVPFAEIPGRIYDDLSNPDDFFESLDFGLAGGAGAEFYAGSSFYFRLLGRFYVGMSDINAEPTRRAPEYAATRNASFGLEAGVGFRIGDPNPQTWTRRPGR
jgi:hypothetical protein